MHDDETRISLRDSGGGFPDRGKAFAGVTNDGGMKPDDFIPAEAEIHLGQCY